MAARKKVDLAAAKAAKQRRMAIVLAGVLALVLVVQGPKTLKLLRGTPSAPAETVAAPATAAPAAAAAAAPAPSATAAAPAEFVSDAAPAPDPGQLSSLDEFSTKDPFVQQGGAAAASAPAPAPAEAEEKAPPAKDAAATPADETAAPSAADGTPPPSMAVAPSATLPTAPAPAATQTVIAVNGAAAPVTVGSTFPADDPVFVLVRLGKNGTSVEIGVAGGSYANGEDTIRLELGKPLTLQNTSDGARYELKLVTVGA